MADRFVVDASVAAKWFLKDPSEDHRERAEEILLDLLDGAIQLCAPRLMSYEVSRLLWKACLGPGAADRGRLDRATALDCVDALFSLPIRFAEATSMEAREAVKLGARHRKNFYDMTYLHLANAEDCQVLTADEKLLRGAPTDFPLQRFVQLRDYQRTQDL